MLTLKEDGYDWSGWNNLARMEALIEINRGYMKTVAHDALSVEEIYEEYGIYIECGVCSDGRIRFAKYARCFEGEIIPRRSIGAKFRYAHAFKKSFDKSAKYARERGKIFLFFITFHWDVRGKEKCCAGWKGETEKAKRAAFSLRDQIRRAFPGGDVCPIVVGMETSREELIFFDEVPERYVAASEMIGKDRHDVFAEIQTVLGSRVPMKIKKYILRLIEGNVTHMTEHKGEAEHIVSNDHYEIAICFGEGYSWMPPHRGLIINPSSMRMERDLLQAFDLIHGNLEEGRIQNGFLMITSALYRDPSEIPGAKEQTRELARFALEHCWEFRRRLHAKMDVMPIIVNIETKELTLVDMDPDTLEFTPLEPIEYPEEWE